MKWYLGVDAGGSYTRAAVWCPELEILTQGHGGPGNPAAVGAEEALAGIETAMAGALGEAGLHAGELTGAVLGVAGLGRREAPSEWSGAVGMWGIPGLRIVSDLEIAHCGSFRGGTGVQVIAGTGSSVAGRRAGGALQIRGGWGWLIDDPGSAVDLGRRLLVAVTALADAGEETAPLLQTVLAHWKIEQSRRLIDRLYGEETPRALLAGLAPLATAQAAGGDEIALEVVRSSARGLAEQVGDLVNRVDWDGRAPSCAVAGSVFRAEVFAEAFQAAVSPFATVVPSRGSPLVGALWAAMKQSGGDALDTSCEAFAYL